MAKGISLHIGLNLVDPAHYDGWSGPLNACEADAHAMADLCSRQGFTARKLLTQAATREAVLAQFDTLASELANGDTLIISYSGHGGQLPDRNKDEADGLDETWCLYNGQLIDDEIYSAWAKFTSGVRIAVFSDSCHSGTILKYWRTPRFSLGSLETPAWAAARLMPAEIVPRTYYKNREFYDALLSKAAPGEPACSVILVSGCQDNQLSMDGPFNGAFTGALLSTWSDDSFTGSYKALAKAVRAKLPSDQSPNYMTVGSTNAAFEQGRAFSL
ncbi:Caspase domain-containing protein [Sphingobium sp. AP50]|uniref:caspase family protein n=1 Tax=Sphingobium sp. AP50 TaxID=1884369 RepID=UPI0008C07DAF|nr:caspase family protein [Sphingobium sp. AP50]SEJ91775.1 Caspase domain-containing protein [Sphingobium sp. AP50]